MPITEIRTAARRRRRRATTTSGLPDTLDQYLSDVGRAPLLNRDDETALARRAREGDAAARDALVRSNLRFVVSIAKQYRHSDLSLPDLISEGSLGLIRASERFDETRGVRFISYAVWWIRQAIGQAIRDHSNVVATPRGARAAQSVGVSSSPVPSAVRWAADCARAAQRAPLSLDAPVDSDSATVLGDVITDERTLGTEDTALGPALGAAIRGALTSLSARDAAIVTMYYGLGEEGQLTLDEVAARVGMSPSRIRERIASSIERLRRAEEPRRALEAFVA